MKRKRKRRKKGERTAKGPRAREHTAKLAKWKIGPSAAAKPPVELWDIHGNPVSSYPTVEAALAEAGDRCGEVWLWCLHCHRFFQAKNLARDFLGGWQHCPFEGCDGQGFDVDILHWRNGRLDPKWPAESELRVGLQYPRDRDWSPALEGTSVVRHLDAAGLEACKQFIKAHGGVVF
jgi:hypothetical protein